ncbi:MAG: hypothetical protein ABI475_03555 [Methylophilaceae bacterium]
MSDQLPEENHELAQVLNRINALMKHDQPPAEMPVLDEEIPLLTEIYEGEPLTFTPRNEEFPTLNQVANSSEDVPDAIPAELIEAVLAEMMPLIQVAVKKAVRQELENAEQSLGSQLEAYVIHAVRERLQSSLP